MRVNDQLENAAIEVISTLPTTVAVGRMLFLTTNSKMYIGNVSKKPVVMGHTVGEIITSMLTLAQFQAEFDDTWVLANGASAAGTDYNSITGQTNLPDLRGRFLRGKNNGRSDGLQDPNGELSIGDNRTDKTASNGLLTLTTTHTHTQTYRPAGSGAYSSTANVHLTSTTTERIGSHITVDGTAYQILGGNHVHEVSSSDLETAPAYTVVNYFIKVNR